MTQIVPGSDNEQYIWDKTTGSLQKVLIANTVDVPEAKPEVKLAVSSDTLGLNSDSLKLLITELKIPLYLIGAGLAVILLIILLERRTK